MWFFDWIIFTTSYSNRTNLPGVSWQFFFLSSFILSLCCCHRWSCHFIFIFLHSFVCRLIHRQKKFAVLHGMRHDTCSLFTLYNLCLVFAGTDAFGNVVVVAILLLSLSLLLFFCFQISTLDFPFDLRNHTVHVNRSQKISSFLCVEHYIIAQYGDNIADRWLCVW